MIATMKQANISPNGIDGASSAALIAYFDEFETITRFHFSFLVFVSFTASSAGVHMKTNVYIAPSTDYKYKNKMINIIETNNVFFC